MADESSSGGGPTADPPAAHGASSREPSGPSSAASAPEPRRIRVSKQKRPEGRVTTLRGLLDANMRTHMRRLRGEL